MNAGHLVAFEGLDGSGKSTQVELLVAALRRAGLDPLVTREPTNGEYGRRIRDMAARGSPPPPEEELRWFVEDRREHAQHVLRPALAQGRVVVTDRYTLSSVAYQGARGLELQLRDGFERRAIDLRFVRRVVDAKANHCGGKSRKPHDFGEPVVQHEQL